jgi:hypothetical protein
VDRVRSAADRTARAWRTLAGEQRLAALASVVLLLTLFLPWYETSVAHGDRFIHEGFNGFGSADFVLASVVLVAMAVLALLFARGERRGFHLPGGDGLVILVAGGWAALLIFYRVIDHPNLGDPGTRVGIQWGVFIAFLAAALLAYAGLRIHTSHRPEPPLPPARPPRPERPDRPRPAAPSPTAPPPRATAGPRRRRPVPPPADDATIPGQMSFDDAETRRLPER